MQFALLRLTATYRTGLKVNNLGRTIFIGKYEIWSASKFALFPEALLFDDWASTRRQGMGT
jgi:hypothetical protein